MGQEAHGACRVIWLAIGTVALLAIGIAIMREEERE